MSFWPGSIGVDMRVGARMMHGYGLPLGDEVEVIGKTNGAN